MSDVRAGRPAAHWLWSSKNHEEYATCASIFVRPFWLQALPQFPGDLRPVLAHRWQVMPKCWALAIDRQRDIGQFGG
eukprot:gene5798-5861_t